MPDPTAVLGASHAAVYIAPFVGVGLESLGLPIPGEATLITATLLAGRGHANPVGIAAAALAGAVLGDNIGYYVGRRWGTRLVKAPVIRRIWTAERMAKADEMFAGTNGFVAVGAGRWVAVLRMFAGPLAGMHHMPWKRFFVANVTGAACWVSGVTAGAYLLGSRAHSVMTDVGLAGLAAVALPLGTHAVIKAVRRRRVGVAATAVAAAAAPPEEPATPRPLQRRDASRRASSARVLTIRDAGSPSL